VRAEGSIADSQMVGDTDGAVEWMRATVLGPTAPRRQKIRELGLRPEVVAPPVFDDRA
jgi:hypothetical protein